MALHAVSNLTASQIGTEKVGNGNFSATTYWTYGKDGGNGWSRDGTNNEADCNGSQTVQVDLTQNISAVATEIYLLQYKIKNWVAGTVTPQIGGVDGRARGVNGTHEDYITATGTGNLKFQANSTFNGTIDDVSVKKVSFPVAYTVRLTWSNADNYGVIDVQYDKGAGWEGKEEIGGSETSYDFEDITPNTIYNFRLECSDIEGEEPDAISNTDSTACWVSSLNATVIVSGSSIEYVTGTDYSDTVTATVYVTGVSLDAISLKTNYAYYLGDSSGKIYEYSDSFKGDSGSNIVARWESKDTDFSDQRLEISNHSKTVEYVRLSYMDKTENAIVVVSVSTDGGATWTHNSKTIGTGDGKGKFQDFHFIKTGNIFRFSIQSASASDEFQFASLEVFFTVGGD